jgi:hypothetical protein
MGPLGAYASIRDGSGAQPPRETREEAGEPNVRQLEPARRLAAADRGASASGVKQECEAACGGGALLPRRRIRPISGRY